MLHGCRPQEVLEGVLAERSTLRKQRHDLQEQLAAALADRRDARAAGSSDAAASTPGGSAPSVATAPSADMQQRELCQELLLAQVGAAAAVPLPCPPARRHACAVLIVPAAP